MKIVIYGAMTGNGHFSVLNALEEVLVSNGHIVESIPDFYEEVSEGNRTISEFYNLVQKRSMKLLELLSDLFVLEGKQKRERQYLSYSMYLDEHLPKDVDVIISVSPLINYSIVRYISEKQLNIKNYIVITDPYRPMYPGFDIKGATAYFCPNAVCQKQLLQKGIPSSQILVSGFPLQQKFFYAFNKNIIRKELNIYKSKVVCVNCGARGNMEFFPIIRALARKAKACYQFLIVCGRNSSLYYLLEENLVGCENFTLYGFVNNMEKILCISDVCITKPGANAIYEALATNTYPLVVGFNGLAYQERGIYDFLCENYGIMKRPRDVADLIDFFNNDLTTDLIDKFNKVINSAPIKNGAIEIQNYITMYNND